MMKEPADTFKPARAPGLELFIVLSRAHQTLMSRAIQDIRQYGLNPTEFAVMELLYHKGPQPLQRIGAKILITSGSITYVVDKLQQKGYLVREACSQDRRITYAALTDVGRDWMARMFPLHEKAILQATAGLNEEETLQAIALLKKLGISVESPPKIKNTLK
jgi:MarR family 2-MHQ and catechol resistance regulon transcriptional repressor